MDLPRGSKFWCDSCKIWVSNWVQGQSFPQVVFDPDKAHAEHDATHVGQGNPVADVFAAHPDLLDLDARLRDWYD
ncbi:MAG TPA: hypothetical protein VFT75_18600 [Nocardioidaceae bacterium]|nr:hypothetical protein [Nocardioidaceae bacterium]